MDNKAEFPDGIFAKAPADRAPDYVKGKVNIKLEEAIKWLSAKKNQGDDWVTLEIKESNSGKWYAAVDKWKPKKGDAMTGRTGQRFDPVPDDDMPW